MISANVRKCISISRVKMIETGELDLPGPFFERQMYEEIDSFSIKNDCVQAKYKYLQFFCCCCCNRAEKCVISTSQSAIVKRFKLRPHFKKPQSCDGY